MWSAGCIQPDISEVHYFDIPALSYRANLQITFCSFNYKKNGNKSRLISKIGKHAKKNIVQIRFYKWLNIYWSKKVKLLKWIDYNFKYLVCLLFNIQERTGHMGKQRIARYLFQSSFPEFLSELFLRAPTLSSVLSYSVLPCGFYPEFFPYMCRRISDDSWPVASNVFKKTVNVHQQISIKNGPSSPLLSSIGL